MAIDQESFNTDLYKLLRTRGYKPVPKDVKNQRTQPEAAEVFNFTFMKDGKDYGDAWVTIDDASNVVLYYSNEQEESPSGKSPGLDYDDSWSGLKRHLKQWSMNKQLTFELRNKDELGDDMAQRDYVKKKEKMNEAYHPMGKKASYNDNIPAVKIILQHNRQIEEGEQRYRNIAKIFLENQDGERFLAPTTRPGIAQVYARHIAEGGVPNDERWNHIKSLCEEYSKMAGFVRATKNKQFNESAQSLVNEGINHYQSLRETLGKLRGHRGYNQYFESWTPALMEDDTDSNKINELFVQETVDPRIESVMPILSRLYKKTGETQVKEVSELAEWADSIVEAFGADEVSSIEKMADKVPGSPGELVGKALAIIGGISAAVIAGAGIGTVIQAGDLASAVPIVGKTLAYVAAGLGTGASGLAMISNSSSVGKRRKITGDAVLKILNDNPKLPQDLEKFVNDLIAQTPDSILKMSMYIANLDFIGPPVGIQDIENYKDSGIEMKMRHLVKLIYDYFEHQEYKWNQLASKYGIDSPTMYYVYEYINNFDSHVEEKWLSGIKQKLKNISLPKGNIKSDSIVEGEETLEDLDPEQKKAGQLGPTEKIGPKGTVGKLVGVSESVGVEEGTPEHEVIMDLINGNLDAYDVMNHPRTPAQQKVAAMMQERYDDIAGSQGFYDDDFEKILNKIVDELADDYDTSGYAQAMSEGQEDLDLIKRLIK